MVFKRIWHILGCIRRWFNPRKSNQTSAEQAPVERPLLLKDAARSKSEAEDSQFREKTQAKRPVRKSAKQKKVRAKLTPEEIESKILHSLDRMGKRGAKTSPEENVLRGIPKHQIGEAKIALKRLKKANLIGVKTSQGRPHVFLTKEGTIRANREQEEQ